MRPIMFFSDEISIRPHTATRASHLSRPVTIREFAAGGQVRLFETGGEMHVERLGGGFMTGPEA